MNKTVASCALAAATCIAAGAAHAHYVGAGVGPSRIDINCAGTTSCDTTDTGFKVYGGFSLPGPFALEAVYFDWGKAGSTSSPGGVPATLGTEASGLGVGGAYFLLFGWGQCTLRAGVAYNKADTTVTLAGVPSSSSHNHTAPYYGFGCAYPLAPSLWLTGEADFSRAQYTATDKANTRLISIGLRFHF
ncbi:MAG: outer membrane beta-barrel protein [Rubrivivax sp.]|nr:outer membrane beta-barrel protein [Rubrivivax sp.]